jgi:hypothetical protein
VPTRRRLSTRVSASSDVDDHPVRGTPERWIGSRSVEVGGIEPPCSNDHLGLLRAQPVGRSRLGAPTGGGPFAQPGCDVPQRPPDGTVEVSLLTTPIPRSQAARGGRLPNVLGSERVVVVGACVWSGVLRDIRDHGPLPPDVQRPSRSLYTPVCSCLPQYTVRRGHGLSHASGGVGILGRRSGLEHVLERQRRVERDDPRDPARREHDDPVDALGAHRRHRVPDRGARR